MKNTVKAGVAAVKVLENWGVKNIYGLPGGSINSLMDALLEERENIHYVQVRHEEVGAMAASMHAKFTGHIGVAFGSAGPGGTHLLNGLYDAREDHVPVLAIIGQFGTSGMNMDTFQEMNEDPIYADVAVYHRVVMTAQSLPHVIDEAIRQAYSQRGVAVVQLPVNLGWEEIPSGSWFDASQVYAQPKLANPEAKQIEKAAEILENAERPLIFAGIGMRGAGDEVIALSKKLKAPIMISALAIDIIDHDYEAFLGSAIRVSRKPANEAIANADTVLMLGTNQPFIDVTNMFEHVKHVVQVDIDPAKLGKRQKTELAILADAKKVVHSLNENINEKSETAWWRANIKNVANWKSYTDSLEQDVQSPLNMYQVYHAINKVATHNALFSTDVGDVTMTSVRHLKMGKGQMWRTSGLFATMGVGLPGAITAKLDYPERQVWSLSGDGAFSMVMQDLATQVQEKLGILNVVFSNEQFGFIKDEQEATNKGYLGVEFTGIDFAKIAEAMGAKGYTVRKVEELDHIFEQALNDIEKNIPVLVDAKITGESPIPAEALKLDSERFSKEEINKFKTRFHAEILKPFSEYMKEEGLSEAEKATAQGGF
ncbi:pyruvate oxidase [Lactococcus allomyrinae]|uniref:Pyruvate oxidase n=1 Tax=Lactococcus allomyrinae TaxID=2419773 RepID=A0A387BCK8_9LACT|nr:pyruvate oxidase [Lactococcus allomyrinae]AYG00198.1 pyruvate oxidase [Lactococcus allomyrinae]